MSEWSFRPFALSSQIFSDAFAWVFFLVPLFVPSSSSSLFSGGEGWAGSLKLGGGFPETDTSTLSRAPMLRDLSVPGEPRKALCVELGRGLRKAKLEAEG